MRRTAAVSVFAVAILVGVAQVAAAKTPPFSMTVSNEAATPGESVTVEVEIDLEYSDFSAEDLNGLLGLFPADAVDENLRPLRPYDFTPVGLPRVEDRVYRGTFTAPSDVGDYVLVPFPNVTRELNGADTYPDPVTITVQATTAPTDGAPTRLLPLAGMGGLAMLAAGVAVVRRRRGEKASANESAVHAG